MLSDVVVESASLSVADGVDALFSSSAAGVDSSALSVSGDVSSLSALLSEDGSLEEQY